MEADGGAIEGVLVDLGGSPPQKKSHGKVLKLPGKVIL